MAELTSEKERLQALRAQRAQDDERPEAPPESSSSVQPWASRLINAGALGKLDWLSTEGRPHPTPALLRWHDGDRDHLLIPAGRVGLLVAPGGTGKSSLLCQLAITVATGRPWLSTYALEGDPGRVLLIMGEEDQDEIKRKLYDAAGPTGGRLTPDQEARVYRNIDCLPLSGVRAPLLVGNPINHEPEPSDFSRWLKDLIDKASPSYRLIIMDPLSRMLGAAAENDNGLATHFIQELEAFTQAPGAPTVIVAHHSNKDGLKSAHSGAATNQGAARGASAFVDGARLMINLEPCPPPDELSKGWGGTRITLRVTKSNYGPPPRPLELFWPTGEGIFRAATSEELARWDEALKPTSKAKSKTTTTLEAGGLEL